MSFSPAGATLSVGQTVAWHNSDSVVHAVVPDAGSAFNTGNIAPNTTSAPVTIGAAGAIPYHCSIHPSMVGQVTAN